MRRSRGCLNGFGKLCPCRPVPYGRGSVSYCKQASPILSPAQRAAHQQAVLAQNPQNGYAPLPGRRGRVQSISLCRSASFRAGPWRAQTGRLPSRGGSSMICSERMAEDGEIDRWRRYVPGNGSDDDLQALRALFAGYTEAEIRRRLNIPDLEADSMPPLDALIRLFHEGLYATEDELPADVLFARLSCRLAGLDNVTVLEGDLYSPVEGLTFDRIAIHPPWAPATQSEFIFGDGGEDGETIIRGSIERLPQFLLPGGRFYAMLLASDRQGEKFEERGRSWLGPG